MILSVLLTHMKISTLQQDLTMLVVAVTGIFQLTHQKIPLDPLVIYLTLFSNDFDALRPTILIKFPCNMLKYEILETIYQNHPEKNPTT